MLQDLRNRTFGSVFRVFSVSGFVPGNMIIPQSSSSSSYSNNSNNNNNYDNNTNSSSSNSNSNSDSNRSTNNNPIYASNNNIPHTHAASHAHDTTTVTGHYHTPRSVPTLPNGEINRNPLCNSKGTNLLCCNTCGQISGPIAPVDEETSLPKRMRVRPPTESSTQDLVPASNKPGTVHHETSSGLSTPHYHVSTGRRNMTPRAFAFSMAARAVSALSRSQRLLPIFSPRASLKV